MTPEQLLGVAHCSSPFHVIKGQPNVYLALMLWFDSPHCVYWLCCQMAPRRFPDRASIWWLFWSFFYSFIETCGYLLKSFSRAILFPEHMLQWKISEKYPRIIIKYSTFSALSTGYEMNDVIIMLPGCGWMRRQLPQWSVLTPTTRHRMASSQHQRPCRNPQLPHCLQNLMW